jgi:tetratricopeptide (TPR) repeat protein
VTCRAVALLVASVAACSAAGASRADDLASLQRSLAGDPENADLHLRLGLCWARSGDGLRAQQYLERAFALGADPRRVLPPLVRVSLALASWEGALRWAGALAEALRPACQREPSGAACDQLVQVLVTMSGLQEALGQPIHARDLLEAAARARPAFADVYLDLARVLIEELHDPAAARAALRRGIARVIDAPSAAVLRQALAALDEVEPR